MLVIGPSALYVYSLSQDIDGVHFPKIFDIYENFRGHAMFIQ